MGISIHVPREGDDRGKIFAKPFQEISIHVPREGDDILAGCFAIGAPISIHVPREGDDDGDITLVEAGKQFQSTSPVRGTTGPDFLLARSLLFQSTSPVRGTTLRDHRQTQLINHFNPRPP